MESHEHGCYRRKWVDVEPLVADRAEVAMEAWEEVIERLAALERVVRALELGYRSHMAGHLQAKRDRERRRGAQGVNESILRELGEGTPGLAALRDRAERVLGVESEGQVVRRLERQRPK